MSYDKYRYAHSFGNLHQNTGGFSHLADTAWRRGHILPKHRLDGINDNNLRRGIANRLLNRIQIGFTQKQQFSRNRSDSACPQLNLF